MAAQNSPFVEGTYGWPYGSSGWNTEMDLNLVKFSYLHDRNIDAIVSSLPAIVNGKAYFNTSDNRLYFDANGQRYSSVTPKWFEVVLRTTGQVYQFDGTTLNLGSTATAYTDEFKADLADNSDPLLGAGLVGFNRDLEYIPGTVGSVNKILSAHPATMWEYSDKVLIKPDPADWTTWDWGPALLAASEASPIVHGSGGTYRISNTILTRKINLTDIKFMPHASVIGQTLLTIAGSNSYLDIEVDAAGKGITAVDVSGNHVNGSVKVSNITGQEQAVGGTQSGLRIQGTDCNLDVYAENLLQGSSSNTSIPRVVTTDNTVLTATRNTIRARGHNVQCGWVTTQEAVNCEILHLNGVKDNGIYHLQGKVIAGSVTIQNCDDEPVVAKDGLHINDLTVIDCHGASTMSGETTVANFTVGSYTVLSEDPTKSYCPLAVRAANLNSKVTIGTLQGKVNLTTNTTVGGIFQFEAGSVSELNIGELNLEVHYKAGSTKILANMSKLKSLNIGRLTIKFIDDTGTLTFADKIDFRLPGALTGFSYIGEVFIVSDSAEVRVANVGQPLLQVAPNMEISTTEGPYIKQENTAFPSPRIYVGPSVPTVGSWLRGDVVKMKAPFTSGVVEYVCITAGTPGVWRASKWLTGRGVSANRPVLTAIDTGVIYFDNTLNANGKPIWWNGTAWVDAVGAVV